MTKVYVASVYDRDGKYHYGEDSCRIAKRSKLHAIPEREAEKMDLEECSFCSGEYEPHTAGDRDNLARELLEYGKSMD